MLARVRPSDLHRRCHGLRRLRVARHAPPEPRAHPSGHSRSAVASLAPERRGSLPIVRRWTVCASLDTFLPLFDSLEVTSKYRSQGFELGRDNIQMITRYDLNFKPRYQLPPNPNWIAREERLYFCGHKLYLARIKPGLISRVRQVRFLIDPAKSCLSERQAQRLWRTLTFVKCSGKVQASYEPAHEIRNSLRKRQFPDLLGMTPDPLHKQPQTVGSRQKMRMQVCIQQNQQRDDFSVRSQALGHFQHH